MADHTIAVWRNTSWRCDSHLCVTIVFEAEPGRAIWLDQTHHFEIFENAEDQLAAALQFVTPFVRHRWIRVEVCVPNRDAYGTLQPGWIGKDCGVLLATRTLKPH